MADDKYKAIRENLVKAEKSLQELAAELQKAKLAGVDVTAQEVQYKESLNSLLKLKAVYGV